MRKRFLMYAVLKWTALCKLLISRSNRMGCRSKGQWYYYFLEIKYQSFKYSNTDFDYDCT